MKVWLVIASVGTLNYLSRLSFIAFFSRRSVPPMLARALRYVPAAMLTALIMPMIVIAPPASLSALATPRVIAAIVAAAIAYRTRSTVLTLVVGMSMLWILQLAMSTA
ncbi:MAG TPA: AzlD domain-containing protein [Casimicrobiaceae bacterium]|nr:AzlD domain-containing protein [Casimicrobiaceae bacterium]